MLRRNRLSGFPSASWHRWLAVRTRPLLVVWRCAFVVDGDGGRALMPWTRQAAKRWLAPSEAREIACAAASLTDLTAARRLNALGADVFEEAEVRKAAASRGIGGCD
jgi:hypothetical protein